MSRLTFELSHQPSSRIPYHCELKRRFRIALLMNPLDHQYDEQDFDEASRLVKSRQYFQRRPQRAAELIAKLMARKGYGQASAVSELLTAWQSVTTESWREQTQPGNIRRGVLEVIVANSVLLQTLEFEKKNILSVLQQQLPQNQIKDIRFRIGNINRHG
jgi:predicted nucleic acid-binding Zn ribbon protein